MDTETPRVTVRNPDGTTTIVGTGQPLYTLDDARAELLRLDCAERRHEPHYEVSAVGDGTSKWLCECGRYSYQASAS